MRPLSKVRVVVAGLAASTMMSWASAEPAITILAPVQPPYTTDEGGKPAGVFVDVVDMVSKDTGLQFKWSFLPWKRAQDLAKQGGDVLIMPLARSPEREPFYEWIVPVLAFDTVLFTVRKPPASLDEARELTIGLMFSTTFEKEVEAAHLTNIERVPDEITNARKLHAGRIDGWITTDMMAPGAYRQAGFNPNELKRGPRLGQTKVLYIAGSPGFPAEVAHRISEVVIKMKKDGRFETMLERYR